MQKLQYNTGLLTACECYQLVCSFPHGKGHVASTPSRPLGHLACTILVLSFILQLIIHTLQVTEVAAVEALPTALHNATVAFGAVISVCTSRAGYVEKSLSMPLHSHRSPMALLQHKTQSLWLAGQAHTPFRSHNGSLHHAWRQEHCTCYTSLVHPSLVDPQHATSDAAKSCF